MAITTQKPISGTTASKSQFADTVVDDLTSLDVRTGKLRTGLIASVQVDSTGTLTPTTTFADIPGCSITFSVTGANAYAAVHFSPDVSAVPSASNFLMVVNANVDGVLLGGISQWVTDDRVSRTSSGKTRKVSLAAGSHTIKLQAAKAQAGGTFTVNGAMLFVQIFDID